MDDLTGLVEGAAVELGLTYFLAGVLPMLVLIGGIQYVIVPAAVLDFFPSTSDLILGVFTGPLLTTIILALILAIVPLVLNRTIIRFFEGYWPGAKVLLAPFYRRYLRLHREYYAETAAARAERRDLLADYEETGDYDEERDFELQARLDALHRDREKVHAVPIVPHDKRYIMPTAFGNAWASAEAYPRDRYGIDAMVFWPYLRTVVEKEDPELIAGVDGQKLLLDAAITLAAVSGILVIAALISGGLQADPLQFAVAAGFAVLYAVFLRAAITYTRGMGLYQQQAYDMYRLNLLDKLGLARPDDLDEEYWVWQRLAAFIRRGEPFYFDMLERAGEEDEA